MTSISKTIFESFLEAVVQVHVFSDAERKISSGLLSDKAAKEVASGKRIDDRIPYLMTISGKGGYVDGDNFMARLPFRNITLLDHVVSVARGAAVFAETDLRASGVADDALARRIAILIATGFLHDADKMLGLSRLEELTAAHIGSLMERYGIAYWLTSHGVEVSADDMLSMINAVEMTRSDMIKPGTRLLSAQEKGDVAYVRLSDRLDGIFLDSRKTLDDLVAALDAFGGFRTKALQKGWRKIHMRSPHTPFILSNFQKGLAAATADAHDIPPLLEIHHDGEFLAVILAADSDAVINAAIRDAMRPLNLKMRVNINPKGTRDILDGGGGVGDLLTLLTESPADCAKALFVHVDHLTGEASLRDQIDAMTAQFNLMPNYGGLEKFTGKHFQPWSDIDEANSDAIQIRVRAAAICIAMGCAEPNNKNLAKAVPDASVREAELIALLSRHARDIPEWMMETGKLSRQTLLAILAASQCSADFEMEDALFGHSGLLDMWLRGDGADRAGLIDKIGDPGAALSEATSTWLRALIDGSYITAEENTSEGRCHFTNIPVKLIDRIDAKSGIDGLKVSAFSGREGRPESFSSPKAQTLVSPVAVAEHRLRTLEGVGVGFGSVPAFISSPSMMGLFASLNLRNERDFLQINQFDLMRLEEKNGKMTFPVSDIYGHRIFFARHFSLPEKQLEIAQQIRMMMRAALRMGRPVHVFRGLPTPQNAFFHIDAAPDVIRRAIGGNSLRIEQIQPAIEILQVIEDLADMGGAGLELAFRYADPETRFTAACEGIVAFERLSDDKKKQKASLRWLLLEVTRDEEISMSQNDNVIIDFARAMATIQEAPRRDASNSIKTLGMRVALEAVEDSVNEVHQTGRESLIAGIAGKLQTEFERAGRVQWIGKSHGNPFPVRKAMEAAEIFVDKVWMEAFSGKAPASKARRIAMAIYQVAFENEHRLKFEARKAAEAVTSDIETIK